MLKYRNVVSGLLLSIFTCGIYMIYWLYKITEDLKYELDNDNNPTLDIILMFVTCGLYSYYVFYRNARQVYLVEEKHGVYSTDNSILHLILAIFGLGLVALILQQEALNNIVNNNEDFIDPLS